MTHEAAGPATHPSKGSADEYGDDKQGTQDQAQHIPVHGHSGFLSAIPKSELLRQRLVDQRIGETLRLPAGTQIAYSRAYRCVGLVTLVECQLFLDANEHYHQCQARNGHT